MKSTYSIKDAKDDLKALNDFLIELGDAINNKQAHYSAVEELMDDHEFARLMNSIRFFQVEGNKYLADVYASKARYFQDKAEK